jgi:DNA-binding NtrC family response regulator
MSEEALHMTPQRTVVPREMPSQERNVPAAKKCVLVFSPDADLAKVLLMNFEDRYRILREHTLDRFSHIIQEVSPDLVLIDLFPFSGEVTKQIGILRGLKTDVPVITLRAYMNLTPEMDQVLEDLSDVLFYKPIDVSLISQAIEDLLKSS